MYPADAGQSYPLRCFMNKVSCRLTYAASPASASSDALDALDALDAFAVMTHYRTCFQLHSEEFAAAWNYFPMGNL